MSADKVAARRLYEEVFGRGKLDAADEIILPGCVSHGAGAPPSTGTDQIKQQALRLRGAIPDMQTVLNDQVAEGDEVVNRWADRGTHAGQLMLPSGPIRIDRFVDGCIVESWFTPDRFTLWQQMGVLKATPIELARSVRVRATVVFDAGRLRVC